MSLVDELRVIETGPITGSIGPLWDIGLRAGMRVAADLAAKHEARWLAERERLAKCREIARKLGLLSLYPADKFNPLIAALIEAVGDESE